MRKHMINWREFPFVRLLLPIILGILSSFLWTVTLPYYIFIFFSIPLVLLTYFRGSYRYRFVYGMLNLFFFCCLGNFLGHHADESRRDHHFSHFAKSESEMVAMVENIRKTARSYRVELSVKAVNGTKRGENISGKLLAYLEQSSEAAALKYGDQIYLSAKIAPIAAPKNPEAFDMKSYLSNQNLHHQVYLKKHDWQLFARNKGNPLFAFSIRTRDQLFHILKVHLSDNSELAVGAALILGKKDLLEAETKMAYANTGAMHVLAVSGLHVGLIYVGISFLLGLFPFRSTTWIWIKTWIMVAGVWFFALLTGASPSVLRAATMFSFIIVGQAMRHHPSIYNTLAASAFFLLCIEPYMLFEVGFQLSYLAVTGIVYFQQKIYAQLYIANRVGDYIWKLTSVSIAAQLVTLPISLYYFHQFPVYFWLSGLVVIPAAVVIMAFAVVLFFIALVVPGLTFIPGAILYWILFLTNGLIYLLSQLPGAVITEIWITPLGLILLYLMIIAVVIAIECKQFRWLKVSVGLLLLFSLNHSFHQMSAYQKSELVIYHTNKSKTLIDVVHRSVAWSVKSEELTNVDIDFIAKNHRMASGAKTVHTVTKNDRINGPEFFYDNGLLQFKNIKILLVDSSVIPRYEPVPKVDYILLENNTSVNLEELSRIFKTKKFILSANNSFYVTQKWKAAADADFVLMDIKEEGAFILDVD